MAGDLYKVLEAAVWDTWPAAYQYMQHRSGYQHFTLPMTDRNGRLQFDEPRPTILPAQLCPIPARTVSDIAQLRRMRREVAPTIREPIQQSYSPVPVFGRNYFPACQVPGLPNVCPLHRLD